MSIEKKPDWQREKASYIHAEFVALHSSRTAEASPLMPSLAAIAARLNGKILSRGFTLRATAHSLKTLWYVWLKDNCKASALLPKYTCGEKKHLVPDTLKAEIQRLASATVGGRDKHQNGRSSKGIWKELNKKWQAGEVIPGLGEWRTWWSQNHPGIPMPKTAPEFPFGYETINRYTGAKVLRRIGAVGIAAANGLLPQITINYSNLRRCEAYTLDDVRLDIVAIDEITGRVVEMTAYILMEISSRYIVAFVLKPKNAIKQEDVDELLAVGLSADGFGIGDGYTTHIIFERGTIACSEAAQVVLEAGSDGGIKIHRTGMDGGIRWVGAPTDKSSGHAMGKGAMEAFNGKLHDMLIALPGQRGNNWANQPANLGVGERELKDPSRSSKSTLVANAEKLAQFKVSARAAGVDCKLELPLLTINGLRLRVTKAIAEYNLTGGHDMQGFHTRTEAEIYPGVWTPVNEIDQSL
jgi:hypothetical protein